MAMKAKKDKTIGVRYSISLRSEKQFATMKVRSAEADLIKQTKKQISNCRSFIGVMSVNPSQQLLHSSDMTHGKLRKLISTGDHQSPLQQQQDSSVRVNTVTKQMHIARKLTEAEAARYGTVSGEMYGYMLTLTRPNTHKGQLDKDYTEHRSRVSKLLKSLKDGATRKNGVKLVGGTYLGAFVSHELTINKKLIEQQATNKIYHPHTHVIVLADSILDVQASAEVILNKWRSLNRNLALSKDAFDFTPVFDPKSNKKLREGEIGAIKEAVKYTVKPDTWNTLYGDSDYIVEVFAEVYNSNKGKKLKQSHGILADAMGFMRRFERFENAIAFTTLDSFPDIVTQLSELVFDPNVGRLGQYNAVYQRELTLDEILLYNRSVIEKSLVMPKTEAFIEEFFELFEDSISDVKMRLFADVFKSITFARNFSEWVAKIQRFADVERFKGNDMKAYDIEMLLTAAKTVSSRHMDIDLALEVQTHTHNNFMKTEIKKYRALFEQTVGALNGPNATLENQYAYEVFLEKQGLNSGADEVKIHLFVEDDFDYYYTPYGGANYVQAYSDDRLKANVMNYMGEALLGDKWKPIDWRQMGANSQATQSA